MQRQVLIFSGVEELSRSAAENFVEIGSEAIEKRGRFTVALAGGSTPKYLYHLLTTKYFNSQINWKSVFFFFGDERNVLPDAEESNFRMANENLLKPLKIDFDKIYRWETVLKTPEKIADDYESSVESFFRGFPDFDLILLGMGSDGHTASLFPFTEALKESEKIAVASYVEKLSDWRFTLTFPVINNARNVIFLVSGADKAKTLKEVLEGDAQPLKYPSQAVKPGGGNLFWLVDEPAAQFLSPPNY